MEEVELNSHCRAQYNCPRKNVWDKSYGRRIWRLLLSLLSPLTAVHQQITIRHLRPPPPTTVRLNWLSPTVLWQCHCCRRATANRWRHQLLSPPLPSAASTAVNCRRKESDISPRASALTDQLVSAQTGLIPQISGKLTHQSLWTTSLTMCVLTSWEILHLMKWLLQNMITNTFLICTGLNLKHIIPTTVASQIGFRDDCLHNNQVITFCDVGSHHQNSIAERKIKDLTLGAQTIHEQRPPRSKMVLSHKHPPSTTAITAQAQINF